MAVFHFVEFWTLKYVHNIDIYSGCQWVTALTSEEANSIFILIRSYGHHGLFVEIKTDNAPVYISSKIKQFCILQYKAYCRYITHSYRTVI